MKLPQEKLFFILGLISLLSRALIISLRDCELIREKEVDLMLLVLDAVLLPIKMLDLFIDVFNKWLLFDLRVGQSGSSVK